MAPGIPEGLQGTPRLPRVPPTGLSRQGAAADSLNKKELKKKTILCIFLGFSWFFMDLLYKTCVKPV